MIYKFEILASLKRVVASHQDFIDAAKKDFADGVPDIEWSEEIQTEASRIISEAGRCE